MAYEREEGNPRVLWDQQERYLESHYVDDALPRTGGSRALYLEAAAKAMMMCARSGKAAHSGSDS